MSKQNPHTVDPLRTVTNRLSSVPVKQLPNLILPVTRLLFECKSVLSQPEAQLPKGSPDALSLHKLKTRINALLVDKSADGRYAAILLIRTIIDVGGYEQLQNSAPWVRGLLSILSRSTDPPASKRLAVIALTRVFLLTHDYQTLIREITTPTLPTYITACLNIVAPKTPLSKPSQLLAQHALLGPILDSFAHLVPKHPNIFRTFLSQINTVIAPLVAPTPSDKHASSRVVSISVSAAAQRLCTLLPICAPKQSNTSNTTQVSTRPSPPSSEAWAASLASTISAVHTTADLIFRAVHEDWHSVAGVIPQPNAPQSYEGPLSAPSAAVLALPQIKGSGLPGWDGVHAGSERVVGLLSLLRTFIEGHTAAAVALPVGAIVDMLVRVMNVVQPAASSGRAEKRRGLEAYSMRINDAIGRDERLGLWAELPAIHAAACEVAEALLVRLRAGALPVAETLLENLLWVFERGGSSTLVRASVYGTLTELVEIAGSSFTREQARALDNVVKTACKDVAPSLAEQHRARNDKALETNGARPPGKTNGTSLNADALFKSPGDEADRQSTLDSMRESRPTDLQDAAHDFVITYTAIIPSRHISAVTRSLIDRTAVLSNSVQAMLASVMNPPHNPAGAPKSRSSILPHLARAFPERLDVEALLRPRMPPIHVGQQDTSGEMEEASEEEDEQEEDAGNEADDMEIDESAPVLDPFAPVASTSSDPLWPLASNTDADNATTKNTSTTITRFADGPSTLGKRSVSDATTSERPEEKKPRVQVTDVPISVVKRGSDSIVQSSSSVPGLLSASDSDDDDNFVMPTLTLEQDTDDEDEDPEEE